MVDDAIAVEVAGGRGDVGYAGVVVIGVVERIGAGKFAEVAIAIQIGSLAGGRIDVRITGVERIGTVGDLTAIVESIAVGVGVERIGFVAGCVYVVGTGFVIVENTVVVRIGIGIVGIDVVGIVDTIVVVIGIDVVV